MRQFDEDRRRKTKKKVDEADGNAAVAVYATAPSAAGRSANSRRVTPTTGAADHPPVPAERLLQNGDMYTGTFVGSAPHGAGKYLWRDGCMYEGEWRKGKASGRGRFSWPSGATFEGEFKAGRMEGHGTFTGPDGDTYVGAWAADRKHGFGRKCYANGDFYEGAWRKNRQEGHGRYVWRNGNQYVGEWKAGVISGRGVLIWSNGNRYDGQWDGGVPKGSGVFTWPDGSCYIGCWGDYLTFHLNGTFYHGAGKPAKQSFDMGWGYGVGLGTRKRSSFDGGRMSFTDKVSNFPRICIWDSDGEAGDITCDIIDNVTCVAAATTPDRGLACAMKNRKPCRLTAADVKKPGQTIAKGHKNYELMLNLQLGIR